MLTNQKIAEDILDTLAQNKDELAFAATSKFVPNAKHIIGNRMPLLNDIAKMNRKADMELVQLLWDKGFFETRMLAAKILGKIAKKDPEKTLELVRTFSKDIDNWALCDTIGMQSIKPLVLSHQEPIFTLATQLNTSQNFWERRLSLVLVEWYTRKKELHPRIELLMQQLQYDKEYYVKKAIVWLKRNFHKAN